MEVTSTSRAFAPRTVCITRGGKWRSASTPESVVVAGRRADGSHQEDHLLPTAGMYGKPIHHDGTRPHDGEQPRGPSAVLRAIVALSDRSGKRLVSERE